MAGGLLNLIAIGNQNTILTGNPTKSFFKSRYVKYTNFGLQKYRLDQIGQKQLSLNQKSYYSFKILRYGDLLMDVYLAITLPDIWSPIIKKNGKYIPYEFCWIKNIGCQIIEEVTFTIGGHIIQKFSGNYLQNQVERDFDNNKRDLFNIMTGNSKELYDPANYSNRNNNYPNAFKINDNSNNAIEPSIHSKQLLIPVNTWFSLMSTMALPLICLQYSEMEINFTLKPLVNLFTIKDVNYDLNSNIISYNDIPRIRADQNISEYGFYRFIREPPKREISDTYQYQDTRTSINSDIHLITTQCFLDEEERILFANNTQNYLIKEVYEYKFERISKSNKIKLESNGLVNNWMWYFQRDDVFKRNEWSNYSNWPYENIMPNDLKKLTHENYDLSYIFYLQNELYSIHDSSKNIYITGNMGDIYQQNNVKNIMKEFGIICDGKYRENVMSDGVFNKIEKYNRTKGSIKEGLYTYNFGIYNDPFKQQPAGAFNTNKFQSIEFEYNNYQNPPIDPSGANEQAICDPDTGDLIGVIKDPTDMYRYNYNLIVMEERYNILKFQAGMADLVYSR
tara:strand:+ start:389 stop:2080 length:1692 start_codon:yes stop_codon:yes gene_type:complete